MHRMMNEAMLRQRLEAESLLKEAFVERDVRIDESVMKSSLIKAILGPRRGREILFLRPERQGHEIRVSELR